MHFMNYIHMRIFNVYVKKTFNTDLSRALFLYNSLIYIYVHIHTCIYIYMYVWYTHCNRCAEIVTVASSTKPPPELMKMVTGALGSSASSSPSFWFPIANELHICELRISRYVKTMYTYYHKYELWITTICITLYFSVTYTYTSMT